MASTWFPGDCDEPWEWPDEAPGCVGQTPEPASGGCSSDPDDLEIEEED